MVPYNWNRPVIRLGCILGESDGLGFLGPDDDLVLRVPFYDEYGVKQIRSLKCSTPTTVGEIFLPSSADIEDIPDETVIAHVCMAGWCKGAAPSPLSTEWLSMFQDEGQVPDFQFAIGNARIYEARPIDDIYFEFDLRKKGTSSPTKTVIADYGTIANYRLQPSEQIRCLAGGLKWRHPTFVHNPAGGVSLSAANRATVIATLLSEDLDTGLNNLWM